MKAIFLVACGGAIGTLFRYGTAVLMKNMYSGIFPWHTLAVNIIGCFLIGFISSWLLQNSPSITINLFLLVGILGGFTTYSGFGLEVFDLFKTGRFPIAILYLLLTNVGGLLAVYCGTMLHNVWD